MENICSSANSKGKNKPKQADFYFFLREIIVQNIVFISCQVLKDKGFNVFLLFLKGKEKYTMKK